MGHIFAMVDGLATPAGVTPRRSIRPPARLSRRRGRGARSGASHDAARFNAALAPFEMVPTRSPDDARRAGRYALENDEHVDVLVARTISTHDGVPVAFEDVWTRRATIEIAAGVSLAMPSIDDLILTKRFGARPRDADDIRWLERLRGAP